MERVPRRAWTVLVLACAVYILSFFHRVCPAVIALDLSVDLGVGATEVGMFSASTMLAYGLMQLPSGLLADAVGGRRTIILLSVLAGLGTLVFAAGRQTTSMAFARVLVGAGLAVTVPSMALLAVWFPPRMYGRASSVLLCCGGLGGVLAAPPLIALSADLGWRAALAVFGGLTWVTAALIALLVPDTPSVPAPIREAGRGTSFRAMAHGARRVLGTASFWPLALWQMCMAGVYFAMASLWWGPYFMQGCGLTQTETGLVLTAASLTLLLAQPAMGCLSDMVFRSRRKPVLMSTAIGLLAALTMVSGSGTRSLSLMVIQIVGLMIGLVAGSPLVFTMAKESFSAGLVGTATGCMNMLFPVWAALMQSAYGAILALRQEAGATLSAAHDAASWLVVANCALALLLCLFMKETYTSEASTPLRADASQY